MIDSLSSWYLEQFKIVSTSLVSLCTEHPRPRRCGQFHSCSYRKVRRKLPILPSDQVVHLYKVYVCCTNSLKASCVIIFKYPKIHFKQMIFIFFLCYWVGVSKPIPYVYSECTCVAKSEFLSVSEPSSRQLPMDCGQSRTCVITAAVSFI